MASHLQCLLFPRAKVGGGGGVGGEAPILRWRASCSHGHLGSCVPVSPWPACRYGFYIEPHSLNVSEGSKSQQKQHYTDKVCPKIQSWEYRMKFGISVFRCYWWYFQVPKYRIQCRYRYRYWMDDTEWLFSVSLNFRSRQKIIIIYMSERGQTCSILWGVLSLNVNSGKSDDLRYLLNIEPDFYAIMFYMTGDFLMKWFEPYMKIGKNPLGSWIQGSAGSAISLVHFSFLRNITKGLEYLFIWVQ